MDLPEKKRETGVFHEIWKAHNQLRACVRSLIVQQSGSRGVKVSRTSNGTLLNVEVPNVPAADPGVVKQFLVKAIHNDYLDCVEWDGSEGDDFTIAKPYGLRFTGWDGLTFGFTLDAYPGSPGAVQIHYAFQTPTYRIATMGTATEHQIIIPAYIADNSIIYASKSENGTGVSEADEWVDMNADGRAWARVA